MIARATTGRIVAVSISPGGIPKRPQTAVELRAAGFVGDGRAHAKHAVLERAVSLFDLELLEILVTEGFPLRPGVIGENLTVAGLDVQRLPAGTRLVIGEGVELRLEAPRKPCYVLDAIDPRLKEVIVGRCGFLASVVRGGIVAPGMTIRVVEKVTPPTTATADVRLGPGTTPTAT